MILKTTSKTTLKSPFILLITGVILFFSATSSAQTLTLRFVSGYCNKVEATLTGVTSPLLFNDTGDVNCGGSIFDIGGTEYKRFSYQLQKLVSGSFVNQGSAKTDVLQDITYRDLTYGDTWRVRVEITLGNGVPSVHPYLLCSGIIGETPGSGKVTVFSNALDTETYNGLTDADLSGVLDPTNSFGSGNGTSFSQRRQYCQADVQADIAYDISGTHGPDHWVINLTRTNLTGGSAGGSWHDYTPAKITASVNVFGEGWLSKYGSSSIWPGQYKVSMNGYQDCDGNPWAYHEDYFEIYAPGTPGTPCRLDIEEAVADVVLYPNPSPNGIINYQTIGEEMEKLDYTIYGMNGQIIKTGMLFGGAGQLDAGNLEAGLYIIKFQSANETISKRLSIAK
ncbi:T9SS type A sorting domain-containing protein [Lewinella sp. LCG006]|uniref:T9SS type A sorting domain-containing protein n=1 Tax=Lewinella sp. LCG006 TaxID=3231911 RepID=UPI00345F8A4D